MKHPTEEKLRAYMDGELPLGGAAAIGEHLGLCADCSSAAAELRETALVFAGAMARMDALEPARWAAAEGEAGPFGTAVVAERAGAGDEPERADPWRPAEESDAALTRTTRSGPVLVRDGSDSLRPPVRSSPPLWRWAAAIALMSAVGGSAAIATGLLDLGTTAPEPAATVRTEAVPAGENTGSGLFASPVNGVIEVVLTRAPAGSRVFVELTDDSDMLVEVEEAAAPHFTSRAGDPRVVVDLGDRARTVRVAMPRGLRSATVVWQGRIVVQVADGAVSPTGAATDGVVLSAQR